MEELALKIDHVYKEYRLGTIGGGTLKAELQSKFAKLRKKEDPNLKIGEVAHEKNERFLALKDISFEIKKGERLAIIGHNGAGKSTLLKLICRVTAPTKGDIYMNGRITSMLEVGTGFHDELTGKENIYLNGAILGMTKSEIDDVYDEIVEFSEIGQFIDTPVKRYSSGMKVKLGFSVASHLKSEIVIMDEVLAVGDVNFQNKCIDRMKQLAEDEGRTILYVSHNMSTVKKLCDRCLVLSHGEVALIGKTEEAIAIYLNEDNLISTFFDVSSVERDHKCNLRHVIQNVELLNSNDGVYFYKDIIRFRVQWQSENDSDNVQMKMLILTNNLDVAGIAFCGELHHIKGINSTVFELDTQYLIPGRYTVAFKVYDEDNNGNVSYYDQCRAMAFVVEHNSKSNHLRSWYSDWGNTVLPCIRIVNSI